MLTTLYVKSASLKSTFNFYLHPLILIMVSENILVIFQMLARLRCE